MSRLLRVAVCCSVLTSACLRSERQGEPVEPSSGSASPVPGVASQQEDHLPLRGPTTNSDAATHNLTRQIEHLEERRSAGTLSLSDGVQLSALHQQRAQFQGTLVDFERATAIAEELVLDHPDVAMAWVARARVRSRLHRFDEALSDLSEAAGLGGNVEAERTAILEAIRPTDETLEGLRALAENRRAFDTLSALASALGRRGAFDEAEQLYLEAYALYRDVSPFIVSWIEFQHGLLHERRGDFAGARISWARAEARLSSFSYAAAHLAEIEATEASVGEAVQLVERALALSGDPEHAAQLSSLLMDRDPPRAEALLELARAGFSERVRRHPLAYADHAARFWLGIGQDPATGLELAKLNRSVRSGPEAEGLLAQAALAQGELELACSAFHALGGLAQYELSGEALLQLKGLCDG